MRALAEQVLSLDEPWRGRFLGLIASESETGGIDGWNGGIPSAAQLANRLLDQDVYRKVDGLLRIWVGQD